MQQFLKFVHKRQVINLRNCCI